MKNLFKSINRVMIMAICLIFVGTINVFAASENYIHLVPPITRNVNINSISLHIPTDKSFSRGKVVWQLQLEDGSWQNITYTGYRDAKYRAGCAYALCILAPSKSDAQVYRVTMYDRTTGVTSISDPVNISAYAK